MDDDEAVIAKALGLPPSSPTYCSACDNVTARTRSLDGWRWRCLMFPVTDMEHFLGEGVRAMEPHGRCLDRNAFGQCRDFTPRRGNDHG